jgi:Zn-dependent membrane protease YugP
MKYLTIILIIFITAACTPQKRLNRKYKKLQKFAQAHNLTISDSIEVILHDTIITETIRKDTIFSKETFYEKLRDTITIVNDRLTIRQYYNNTIDSIFIEGECAGDSIPYEVKVFVPVDKPVVVKTKIRIPWWHYLVASLLGIGLGVLVIKLYKILTK